jgi:hypothetical protein
VSCEVQWWIHISTSLIIKPELGKHKGRRKYSDEIAGIMECHRISKLRYIKGFLFGLLKVDEEILFA